MSEKREVRWADDEPICTFHLPAVTSDPVHEHQDGTWWFFDEVWTYECGPYETKEECNAACSEYAKAL